MKRSVGGWIQRRLVGFLFGLVGDENVDLGFGNLVTLEDLERLVPKGGGSFVTGDRDDPIGIFMLAGF